MAYNRTIQHFTSSQELATIWASGQNYIVNQLVLDSDKLYRCNTSHTSGATFAGDSAYWTGLNQGGIIDIAGGGTGQTTATAAFDALAPTTTAGDLIVYNGTDNIRLPVGSDGQTIIADSSQTNKLKWATIPQGNKNYITYSNFENNATTGWSLFNTTLTSKIPTGSITAGAASLNALAVTASTPLAGLYSLIVTSPAAVSAGQGFITDVLTIDREDQAKVLTFSFYYEVVSGGSNMNFSGTSSNTWAVYIHDGTNWIQPAGVYGMTQSAGAGIVTGTFQTNATGTSYRVAVVCINATGGAVSLEFDDFKLGPQTAPIAQLRNPVGTIIATGSLTPPNGYLYCNGEIVNRTDYAELFAAIGTSYNIGGETGTQFRLPDLRGIFARGAGSQTIGGIGYSATLGNKQNDAMQGHRHWRNPNNSTEWAILNQATGRNTTGGAYAEQTFNQTGSPANDGTNGEPRTASETRPANQAVAYHICFSSGNVQTSDSTDTRVVAFAANKSATQSIPNTTNTVIDFNSVEINTHGSTYAAGAYTVPVSGYYKVAFNFNFSTAGSNTIFGLLYKNGSPFCRLSAQPYSSSQSGGSGSTVIYLNAGENVSIGVFQSSGSPQILEGAGRFSVERLSGPSVVAASETVAEIRENNAGSTIGTGVTVIPYPTTVKSTHGGWDSVNHRWTAPISGTYLVTLLYQHPAPGLDRPFELAIRKNTVTFATHAHREPSTATVNGSYGDRYAAAISTSVPMSAGEYIDFTSQCPNGAVNLYTPSGTNRISIIRVGN